MTDRTDRVWPWAVDAALVLYIVWVAYAVTVRVPVFGKLFSDLGAEVPAVTSFTIKACTSPTPYLVAGFLALALVLKNRLLTSTTAQLGVSLLALVCVSALLSFVHEVLFRPMLHLMQLIK